MCRIKPQKVLRPRCIDCEFRFASFGDKQCPEGIVLEFGKQYCSYGKTYREFRKKDPKVYPPNWCPRMKTPTEFRIYDFKDVEAWFIYRMSRNNTAPPSYRCAVRIDGTTRLSPVNFFREALTSDVSTLLGVKSTVERSLKLTMDFLHIASIINNEVLKY